MRAATSEPRQCLHTQNFQCHRSADAPPATAALLAVLTDCEAVARCLLSSAPALAALTADVEARAGGSLTDAHARLTHCRTALAALTSRGLRYAKRMRTAQSKRAVAALEALGVSTEQLRVWSGVAGGVCGFDSFECACECAVAASPLLASPSHCLSPLIEVYADTPMTKCFGTGLGCVGTGDGLRVVSASGPGLKWFEPHSRNEFSVVLVQADGSVPVWLTAADLEVAFIRAASTPPGRGSLEAGIPTATVTVGAGCATDVMLSISFVRDGVVSIEYTCLTETVTEVQLQLVACGIAVSAASDVIDWAVRVKRRPPSIHECAARGSHVRTLPVVAGYKLGLAVSPDEQWLVVGLCVKGTVHVHSLPGCELVRTFGGKGTGPLQFNWMRRMCFAPNGHLLAVDSRNQRVQEVTLGGEFVRCIGVGEFGVAYPHCVAAHNDVIAVGCADTASPRVVLFNGGTGDVTLRFDVVALPSDRSVKYCTSVRFTADGSHLVVAECLSGRLSLFSDKGALVRRVGEGVLGAGAMDVLLSCSNEVVVADYGNHRVCVFSPDGLELVRSWGMRGTGEGQFVYPGALASVGKHLYVADENSLGFASSARVQVFE